MNPARHNLGEVVQGNTWAGFNACTLTVDGLAPASPLASVVVKFTRLRPPVNTQKKTISGVITNAAAWAFNVPATVLDMEPGEYIYTLTTTSAAGEVKTYLTGKVTILGP